MQLCFRDAQDFPQKREMRSKTEMKARTEMNWQAAHKGSGEVRVPQMKIVAQITCNTIFTPAKENALFSFIFRGEGFLFWSREGWKRARGLKRVSFKG